MINWRFPYNSVEWTRLKNKQLNKQPYCVKCFKTWDLQVDHIISHFNREDLFLDVDNLQTLCIQHHAEKTNKVRNLYNLKIEGSVVIELNGDIDLDNAKYIKYYAHQFIRNNDKYVFNIKQSAPSYSQLNNLIDLLIYFFNFYKFRSVKFVCANTLISDVLKNYFLSISQAA